MVVEQTEGKTKTEVSELKQQLQHAESTAQQAMAGRNLDMLYLISNHIFKVMCLSVNPWEWNRHTQTDRNTDHAKTFTPSKGAK